MSTALRQGISSHLSELKQNGCLKIRVTDPKRIPKQRDEVSTLASRLGRSVCTSYRYPWLYAVLGIRPRESAVQDTDQTNRRRAAKDALRLRIDPPGLIHIQE